MTEHGSESDRQTDRETNNETNSETGSRTEAESKTGIARRGSDERAALASEVARLASLVQTLRAEGDALREKQRGGPSQAAASPSARGSQSLAENLVALQKREGLGVLARAVAHDLNNHLTVILGNCSLVQADLQPGSPLHARLDRARAAAQQSAALTEQLLAYSTPPAAPRKPIHLPHSLEAMRDLLDASLGKRCELSIESSPGLPLIQAAESEIQQLVFNLVSNAAEAIEHKPGHTWVRVGAQSADQTEATEAIGTTLLPAVDYVYLEVEDNGSGIPEADQPHIFEPFFSTKLPGRGLGLAAVLDIVRAHGGAIQLDSTPGVGTKIRVLFPQLESAKPNER